MRSSKDNDRNQRVLASIVSSFGLLLIDESIGLLYLPDYRPAFARLLNKGKAI